jgi:signal transduction histidine kinase
VLIALAFLPLVLRRRYPVSVLVVTTAATALYEIVPNPPALTMLGMLVALYTLGTLVDRRRLAVWGGAAALVMLVASQPDLASEGFWTDMVRMLAVVVAAALLGDATRNRRAYVAEVEQRAVEAELTREEEARRRVDEERLRIARELHDVTAHSLSVIAVQSGAAAHVLDTDPAEARRSLVAIRETSRSALQELRSMLGVLRRSEDADELPLAPAPGLARLGDLVRPLEEAGLSVDVVTEGDVADVPALVDASAYRIVQEALTNVLRHAGKAHATIAVRREPDALTIEVTDDGAGGPAGDEGHGIAGMRERAQALGGSLAVGPIEGGGWRVSARLPVMGRSA